MSIKKDGLQQIIGKTIREIIVSANNSGAPKYQLLIVFADETHYEFYGEDLQSGTQTYDGDAKVVLQYIKKRGGQITRVS